MKPKIMAWGFALLAGISLCSELAAEVSEIVIGDEVVLTRTRLSSAPVVAHGEGVYLVVWQEGYSGVGPGSDIWALRIKPGPLKVIDREPIRISTAAGNQDSPAVAFDGENFLVVWSDMRGGKDYDIYGARVRTDGKVLDPEGIPVAIGEHNQAVPVVASDGRGFLVAWMDYQPEAARKYFGYYYVRGARLSGEGKVLDPDGIEFAKDAKDPSVAYNGTHYLVAWSRGPISGVQVDPATGKCVGERRQLSDRRSKELPRLVSDGKDFLYTCSARPEPNPWGWGGPGFICAERVLPDGSTPDRDVDVGYYMGNAAAGKVPNYIDCAGWRRGEGKVANNWPAGEPGGFKGTPYNTWPYRFSCPASVGDGYLVAWVRMHLRQQVFLYDPDIIITYVEPQKGWRRVGEEAIPAGANARKYGLPAAASPEKGESMPWLASGPGGEALLVYEVDTPGKSLRIAARKITVR